MLEETVTGLRNSGPLKYLTDSKHDLHESKWLTWSSRINFIPFSNVCSSNICSRHSSKLLVYLPQILLEQTLFRRSDQFLDFSNLFFQFYRMKAASSWWIGGWKTGATPNGSPSNVLPFLAAHLSHLFCKNNKIKVT